MSVPPNYANQAYVPGQQQGQFQLDDIGYHNNGNGNNQLLGNGQITGNTQLPLNLGSDTNRRTQLPPMGTNGFAMNMPPQLGPINQTRLIPPIVPQQQYPMQIDASHMQGQIPHYGLIAPGNPYATYQFPYPQYVGSFRTDLEHGRAVQYPHLVSVPMHQAFQNNASPPANTITADAGMSRDLRLNYGENYKPIRPKKNSKPRIKKISRTGSTTPFSPAKKDESGLDPYDSNGEQEESIDTWFVDFQKSLKIDADSLLLLLPPVLELKTELERKLFDTFSHQLSQSMDMFMVKDFFSDIVPIMAVLDDTGMILNSMFNVSALMLQRIDPTSIRESDPINYYHQTIRSIRHYLSLRGSGDNQDGVIARCLLSTVLLGVYEMFFLASDSTYVKGAVSLLTSLTARSSSRSPLTNSVFLQTCFWATFVYDLILSLKFSLPSMFSVQSFWAQVDPEYIGKFTGPIPERTTDDTIISREEGVLWLHRALINFSIINEFNTAVKVPTKEDVESNKSFHDWLALNNKVIEFDQKLPMALKPIIYKPCDNEEVYPTIYFRDELAALITLQNNLAKISLFQALIQRTDLDNIEVQNFLSTIPRNHAKLIAKDVIGILKTYDLSILLWPINIHTIRHVSIYLHDDEKEYKELEVFMEKIILTCHFIFQSKVIIG